MLNKDTPKRTIYRSTRDTDKHVIAGRETKARRTLDKVHLVREAWVNRVAGKHWQ